MDLLNDGDGLQAQDINQLFDKFNYFVNNGCQVSPGTNDLTVQVSSGEAVFNGSTISVSAQDNVALTTADGTNPRKDIVYLDSGGNLQVAQGTAEAADPSGEVRRETFRPAPPDLSQTNATVLAEVWVPAGATDITAGDVIDRRVLTQDTFDELRITGGNGFLGLPNHHVNYADGLSNEEISRFTLDAGQVLEVWRLEAKLKGGGTNGSLTVDVYDETNATVLASTTDKVTGDTSPIGTSGDGATIIVRVSNSTGAAQDVCITGIKSVVNN